MGIVGAQQKEFSSSTPFHHETASELDELFEKPIVTWSHRTHNPDYSIRLRYRIHYLYLPQPHFGELP